MRLAKRCALFLHSAFFLGLFALIATLGLPGRAWAYVDPSVMTYAIQALAGVAVALSAVIGVAFRRSRRALMRILGIDEDAKKEHDPAVHELIPDAPVTRRPSPKPTTTPAPASAACPRRFRPIARSPGRCASCAPCSPRCSLLARCS